MKGGAELMISLERYKIERQPLSRKSQETNKRGDDVDGPG